MFIISLTYEVPLSHIDRHLEEHIAFLDRYFDTGDFLASGPKNPRTGGVILATVGDRKALDRILAEDPFRQLGLARYDIEEFRATRFRTGLDTQLKDLLGG